jgi:hypothetical protein
MHGPTISGRLDRVLQELKPVADVVPLELKTLWS